MYKIAISLPTPRDVARVSKAVATKTHDKVTRTDTERLAKSLTKALRKNPENTVWVLDHTTDSVAKHVNGQPIPAFTNHGKSAIAEALRKVAVGQVVITRNTEGLTVETLEPSKPAVPTKVDPDSVVAEPVSA